MGNLSHLLGRFLGSYDRRGWCTKKVAATLKNIATLHEARLRHASHYLKILREADRNYYLGHDTLEPGLKLFDSEWSNIQEGQAWARDNAGHDENAASLCINFPYWAA